MIPIYNDEGVYIKVIVIIYFVLYILFVLFSSNSEVKYTIVIYT